MSSDDHRAGIQARLEEITGPQPGESERALLARVLGSYVKKTPPGMEQLAVAWEAGDVVAVRDQAHALKGSATNIGALAMSELFAGIEDAARAGQLAEPGPALQRIRETFAQVEPVCAAMAAELQG
ncbi:Hpt domain-containing protein [Actinoplanes sp. TFC3]|uniref:Hpt domain-containing protein n=1 Tax=Actinoplanes sp. TFC3 TaxID=1710355 RepID=UPI000829CBDF|nr:Hpt domain-containing protein [Actinoplanes sp. TFC3]